MAREGIERRLAVILSADVVSYSRLMAADDAGTFAQLKTLRKEPIEPKTTEYNGRVIELMVNGTLMEFASVVDAVTFAVELQQAMPAFQKSARSGIGSASISATSSSMVRTSPATA